MTLRLSSSAERKSAFTIAELLVAVGVCSLLLGSVAVATISLTKSFNATEKYSRAQAAQIRLIDSVAMDLRRATAIGITNAPGSVPGAVTNTTTKFVYDGGPTAINTKRIQDGTFDRTRNRSNALTGASTYLTLKIPGYYQSNSASTSTFRKSTTLMSTGKAVRYGTSSGVAADLIVEYREAYVPTYGSQCYIRREAGVDKVIVEKAELMDLDIAAQANNSFIVDAWFTPTYSSLGINSNARVTSSDRVMLRNPRTDL